MHKRAEYNIFFDGFCGTSRPASGASSVVPVAGNPTFVREVSGYSNTTGNFNLFSGSFSGYQNTIGNFNLFSGY